MKESMRKQEMVLGDTKSTSRRRFKNKLWEFLKVFLASFDLIGGLVSIYGTVYSIIGRFKGLITWSVVSCIIFIVLFVTILVFIRSRKHDMMREAYKYSVGFHSVLHQIRDEYADLQEEMGGKEKKNKTPKQFQKYMIEHVGGIMTVLADYLSKATGEKVRACIKVFDEATDGSESLKTYTLARSNGNTNDIRRERRNAAPLDQNTDFNMIYKIKEGYEDEREHFFIADDLDEYRKKYTEYRNSTDNYLKRYKTTIVMPVRYMSGSDESKKACIYDIIAYLCVDSKKKNLFAGDSRELIIEYLKGISDILYVYLNECISYYKFLCEETIRDDQNI